MLGCKRHWTSTLFSLLAHSLWWKRAATMGRFSSRSMEKSRWRGTESSSQKLCKWVIWERDPPAPSADYSHGQILMQPHGKNLSQKHLPGKLILDFWLSDSEMIKVCCFKLISFEGQLISISRQLISCQAIFAQSWKKDVARLGPEKACGKWRLCRVTIPGSR